jgi:hypothetical protein
MQAANATEQLVNDIQSQGKLYPAAQRPREPLEKTHLVGQTVSLLQFLPHLQGCRSAFSLKGPYTSWI